MGTFRAEEISPRHIALHIIRNRLLYLLHLKRHELRVLIPLAMILNQDLPRLIESAARHQPARGLGTEPDKAELVCGRHDLDQSGQAPRPLAGDAVCAECDPGADCVAEDDAGVVEGCDADSFLDVGKLGDENCKELGVGVRNGCDRKKRTWGAHLDE
jgi:hypothetical protein